jgi:hypothetical protein
MRTTSFTAIVEDLRTLNSESTAEVTALHTERDALKAEVEWLTKERDFVNEYAQTNASDRDYYMKRWQESDAEIERIKVAIDKHRQAVVANPVYECSSLSDDKLYSAIGLGPVEKPRDHVPASPCVLPELSEDEKRKLATATRPLIEKWDRGYSWSDCLAGVVEELRTILSSRPAAGERQAAGDHVPEVGKMVDVPADVLEKCAKDAFDVAHELSRWSEMPEYTKREWRRSALAVIRTYEAAKGKAS